ncbi:MAG: hypothetical protein CMC82_08195 [Flavobacteriaceae bacterium]|nr:hypothetical protein [Flavobacteriaceae bacterium]
MNYLKFVSLILIYQINFLSAQCDDSKTITYTDGSIGTYVGCLDDYENFEGTGVLTNDTFVKSGNWKLGKLDGEGALTLLSDSSVFQGNWKNDELINGSYNVKTENFKLTYFGSFRNLKFHGTGKRTFTTSSYTEIQEGNFFNDILFDGTEVTNYATGLIITNNIEQGDVVISKRNDRNYFNPNKLIGNVASSKVLLDVEGGQNEGKTFFVNMNIDAFEAKWVFDSGAQLTSIGKRMFERLKDEGVTFKDLNLNIKTFGVGGVSNGNLVIIENVRVGDYLIKDFIFKVNLDNNFSLLGMDFMDMFSNVIWNKRESTLTFYK